MKLHRQGAVWALALCAAFPFCGTLVHAQPYPTKPVRLIVGFAPGSTTDILARLMGQWLSQKLGKQFIVENRPGAGGPAGLGPFGSPLPPPRLISHTLSPPP